MIQTKKRNNKEFLHLPFRYQAGIVLLVLFCIITTIGYGDPCKNENPEQSNNNCIKNSDESPNGVAPAEQGQAATDTDFSGERTAKASGSGDMSCTSENEGSPHPRIPHQEGYGDCQQGGNAGELHMNPEGKPHFPNEDNRKAPSFPGHSMGSCPMRGGFTPSAGMSDGTCGPGGPVKTIFTSGNIALKSTFLISGFGFPMGLDVISHSILDLLQGPVTPGGTEINLKATPPAFLSNKTDGIGPVSGPSGIMGPDRGCENQDAPRTGDDKRLPGDRFAMGTSHDGGEFHGVDQKQIPPAGSEDNPKGGSPPVENRGSP